MPRDLPRLPGYVKPVTLPSIKAGMNPKVLAAQALAVAEKANGIIRAVPGWYDGVRADYAAPVKGR